MRSFAGTRTAEGIPVPPSMLQVRSWEALVFGIPRDLFLWEGIQLKYPP